jgi:hypothetical protein
MLVAVAVAVHGQVVERVVLVVQVVAETVQQRSLVQHGQQTLAAVVAVVRINAAGPQFSGAAGGSGIVIIRYPIG